MKKIIYVLLGLATGLALLFIYWLFYNRFSEKEKMLIGDGNKIWYLRFENGLGKQVTYMQFQFLGNNTYIKYFYDKNSNKRTVFNDLEMHPDITPPRKIWRFHNDSILEFGEDIKSKILYLTPDSFALEDNIGKNKKDTSIFYLIK